MTNETKPVEINIPLSEVTSVFIQLTDDKCDAFRLTYCARKILSNSGGPVVAGGETEYFLRA